MARHLVRSSSSTTGRHRDRAADRSRRKAMSALSGHVDYIELAERVGQGVTVDEVTSLEPSKPRSRKSSGR